MTDSLHRLGIAARSTDSLHWSYGRTYVRTYAERRSPRRDNSPSVTHARTYGFSEVRSGADMEASA